MAAARLIRRPLADRDALDCALFIAEDNLDAAERFLGALETSYALLLDHPGIGQRRDFNDEKGRPLRAWPVPGFASYLVFYFEVDDVVEVVRILHGARDLPALFDSVPPH